MGRLIADGQFREETVFRAEDTDKFGRVEGSAILRRMQDIAGAHYDALGLTGDEAAAHGCFWAVNKTELVLAAPPPADRELTMDTWTGKQGHGLFWRHYMLRDGDAVLARGASLWVLMDLATRSLSRDRNWVTDKTVVSLPGELETSRRHLQLPGDLPQSRTRTVEAGDADVNGHLNNANYLRWASELLPEDFAAGHRLSRAWIEYKKELPLGRTVLLSWLLEGESLYLRGNLEDAEAFVLRCDYDPV